MKNLELSLIVAMTPTGVIGNKGTLPWGRISSDMDHFKKITVREGTVIMGRKTWDSIPEKFRPLPGRNNIVVTRGAFPESTPPKTSFVASVEEACEVAASLGPSACVTGGGEIYRLFLLNPDLKKIYITVVHELNLVGDTYFPLTLPEADKEWKCVEATSIGRWHPKDEHDTSLHFYERVS